MDVSIIIPAYNAAAHLGRAIESVLVQEGVFFEVIIVDNNSTDETLSIAKEYQSEHPDLITVFSEIEQGAGAARNKGLSMAKGTFVQFLDADDILLPAKLLRQSVMCQEVDWVIGVSRVRGVDGQEYQIVPHSDAWKGIVSGRIGDMNANFFRRETLVEIGGQNNDYKRGQDIDMYLRLLKKDAKYVVDLVPGAIYIARESKRLFHEDQVSLLARILQRDREIHEYLEDNYSTYFSLNQKFFTSNLIARIRRLATVDFKAAKSIYAKALPEGIGFRYLDLQILPIFSLLYPIVGFSTVEKLRLVLAVYFSVELKRRIKRIL